MIFRLASETGLRWSEIRSLTVASFSLAADTPTVFLAAGDAKNRTESVLPIRPALATKLKDYFALKLPTAKAFNLPATDCGAKVVKHYLALTDIPYENDAGERFDFHALRGQFATSLARNGVSLAAARELMRHSTVDLTAKFYTHLRLDDKASAIAKLPDIDVAIESEAASMTGTYDVSASGLEEKAPEKAPFRGTKIGVSCHSVANSTEAESLGLSEIEQEEIAENAYTVTTKTPLSSSDKGGNSGSPGRTRTYDLLINSQPLYQLSYRGSFKAINTKTCI